MVGFLLPWAELVAGLFLLLGFLFPAGPLVAAALGASFAYASFRVLRRGADVPCGCTGNAKDRVNRTTLIRGAFITASSLFLLSADGLNPSPLSLALVAILILASLLPAAVGAYRRVRALQWHKRQALHLQEELERARRILNASPSTPGVILSEQMHLGQS